MNLKSTGMFSVGVCLLGLVLVSLVMVHAQAKKAEEATDPGTNLYLKYCSSCHGKGGQGDGPVAPALKGPMPDLTLMTEHNGGEFPIADAVAYMDGRIEIAAHGSREMPVWGEVFKSEMVDGPFREEMVGGKILVIVDFLNPSSGRRKDHPRSNGPAFTV